MSDICATPADHSFKVISMETVCPTTISKCKWTVKDFTKYPLEEIKSHLIEPNETDACEFVLQNFPDSDASVCPVFCVKYYSDIRVYATFKVTFYDSKGEELYKMEETRAFCPPKRREFQMKDFPLKKVLELEEDTLLIECEMKTSRPNSILHNSDGQGSQSPLIPTSEDPKSLSSIPSPSEDAKSLSPSEDSKSLSPSEDSKSLSPSEDSKSLSPIASPSEDSKSLSSIPSPSEDSGICRIESTAPSEDSGI